AGGTDEASPASTPAREERPLGPVWKLPVASPSGPSARLGSGGETRWNRVPDPWKRVSPSTSRRSQARSGAAGRGSKQALARRRREQRVETLQQRRVEIHAGGGRVLRDLRGLRRADDDRVDAGLREAPRECEARGRHPGLLRELDELVHLRERRGV